MKKVAATAREKRTKIICSSTEQFGTVSDLLALTRLRQFALLIFGQKRLVKATLGGERIVVRRIGLRLPFSAFREQPIAFRQLFELSHVVGGLGLLGVCA